MTLRSSLTTSRKKPPMRPKKPVRRASFFFLGSPLVRSATAVPPRPTGASSTSSSDSVSSTVSSNSSSSAGSPASPGRFLSAMAPYFRHRGGPPSAPVSGAGSCGPLSRAGTSGRVAQGGQDLNLQPAVLETAALPIELHPCAGPLAPDRGMRLQGVTAPRRTSVRVHRPLAQPALPFPYDGLCHGENFLPLAGRRQRQPGVALVGLALHRDG